MSTPATPTAPTSPNQALESPNQAGSPAEAASPADGQPQVKIDPAKDLWTNIAANVKDAGQDTTDSTVLVVGTKHGGKTSVVQRMLGASSSSPKPTTALEYSYGKREERSNVQIAHFWELAQGTELSQLCDVVLVPETIHATLAVIVVDCGEPSTALDTATFWLKKIDSRTQELFQKMRAKGSQTPDKLISRAKKRIGDGHPDLSRVRVCGVPTVIVCNRLDKYALDTGKLKLFARSMRYLAHLYGAAVVFTSEHEREVTRLRALLNHVIFAAPFDAKFTLFDSDKGGVLSPSGADTFAAIGDPTPCNMANFKSTGDGELDRWKAPFDETFPQKGKDDAKKGDRAFLEQLYDTSGGGYGEALVDAMRKQKDTELEQYRKAASAKKADKGKD